MSYSTAASTGSALEILVGAGSTPRILTLGSALVLGSIAAGTIALWFGNPAAYLAADPELARLLRGMALIKAGLVVGAMALLLWRLRRPVTARTACVYLLGTWWMAGASMLIWQLTLIPLAAITFHVGELSMLVAAWRDHGEASSRPPA